MDDDDFEDDFDGCEEDRMLEFGCAFPGECCMSGLHFTSECHTAAYYEGSHPADSRRSE